MGGSGVMGVMGVLGVLEVLGVLGVLEVLVVLGVVGIWRTEAIVVLRTDRPTSQRNEGCPVLAKDLYW